MWKSFLQMENVTFDYICSNIYIRIYKKRPFRCNLVGWSFRHKNKLHNLVHIVFQSEKNILK